MPPVVGFQTYLTNAQKLVAQDSRAPQDGEVRPADRALGLNGHTISVVPGNGHSAEADRARTDFIASFVEQFGEGCRVLVERALLGMNAKPLTARLIVELNAQAIALKPNDLTASLSDLLRRAAQADAGGVTHEHFKELARTRPELGARLSRLNAVRQQAEEALTRLGAFTGSEIAAAFRPAQGSTAHELEVRNVILVLVRTAVNKLLDLAEGLRRVYEEKGDSTGDLFDMITRSSNRAMEVQRLVIELSNLDAGSDDARLGMYAAEMLPKLALQMHGTQRALEHLRMSLQPLADRFDAMRAAASEDGRVGLQDVALLLREISIARDALKEAARRGIKMSEGDVVRPDPGLLRSLDALLDRLQADVHRFTAEALEEKAKHWVRGVVPSFSATKLFTVYRDVVKDVSEDREEMERFLLNMETVRMAAMAWAQGMFNIASLTLLNDSYLHLSACIRSFKLAADVVCLLRAICLGDDRDDARSERMAALKGKLAVLLARFQKLGDKRLREIAVAADEDRMELEKLQRLLEAGPNALNGALRIQRLFDLLVERRHEGEEVAESNGSPD